MKKHIARFLLLSAVIFLASACAKDEFQSLKKGNSLVFKGRIENTGTRTVVLTDGTEGKVYWVDGDEVRINGIPYLATVDEEDPRSATFTKKDENDPDPEPYEGMYYATYSCTYDPEIEVGQLPPSQYYADNSPMCAPMFAQSESSDLFLAFKNINALLEITLKGTGTIRSIKLSSDNVGMTGKFAVKDGQSAYIVDEDKKAVTLYCISGVPVNEEGVKFYVSIPSGEYEAMNVLVTDIAGNTWETTAKNTAVVESNKIYPLTFEPAFPISDFTGFGAKYTDDGGKNWYGAESLADALENIAGKNKSRSIIEVLEDSELGENELPDLSGKKITIIGNGHTWDVSERTLQIATDDKTDVKIEGLIIDGKNVVNSKRFYYNKGILTFGLGTELKNLVFEQPVSNAVCGVVCNDAGGVINIDGAYIHDIKSKNATESGNCHGGFISNFNGTVNMTGGVVENLTCEGSGDFGGAFVESNSSSCVVNITGGSFKNCKANVGGAINCQTGKLNLSNASFTDCSGKKGGVIFFNGKGTITNTKFTNCEASDLGGAIRVNGTATELTITDCTISDCTSANNAGAISATAGVINLNGNTSILNCTATTYGGGIYLDSSAKMNISGNTKIDACKSTRGGAIFTAHSANVACTISENVTISNCIAEVVNKTNWGGGAIWAASKFEIKGGRFINNTIKTTAGQQLYGAVLTSGTGANAAVTISGGVFISDINASMLCTADKGATMSVTGGTFVNLNQGTGATIFTCAFTNSTKPVMKGGYFNKQFNKWVDYTGYQLVDNPQATADDQAAYAEGATLKLVAK